MTSSNDQNKKWDEDVWVCDSAATCNMHWSLKGFLSIELKNETIEVGDGETIGIKGRGTYIGIYMNSAGETKNIILNNDLKFIDRSDFFCNQERCLLYSDNKLLFQDIDHITEAGAIYMGKIFEKIQIFD